MKNNTITYLLTAMALAGVASCAHAKQQKSSKQEPLKIVGYHGGKIFEGYPLAKDKNEEIRNEEQKLFKYLQTLQVRRNVMEEEFNIERSQLDSNVLTEDKKTEIRTLLAKKAEEIQKLDREAMAYRTDSVRSLEMRGQEAKANLMDNMTKAVSKICKENKVGLAIDTGNPSLTLFSEGVEDITEETLALLTKQYNDAKEEEKAASEEGSEEAVEPEDLEKS